MIVPSRFHAPPRPPGASARICTVHGQPRSASFFLPQRIRQTGYRVTRREAKRHPFRPKLAPKRSPADAPITWTALPKWRQTRSSVHREKSRSMQDLLLAASKFQGALQRLPVSHGTRGCPLQRQEPSQPRMPLSILARVAAVQLAGLQLLPVAGVPRSQLAHRRYVEAGAAAPFAENGAATGEYSLVSPPATSSNLDLL